MWVKVIETVTDQGKERKDNYGERSDIILDEEGTPSNG